jgi:type I restriction enzyme, S subunit
LVTATDWSDTALSDLIHLQKGVSYKGEFLDKPGPYLLGLGTVVPGGGLKLDGARTYSGPIREGQRIKPGELLLALTDITQEGKVLGTPALVPRSAQGEFAVTHHVARVEVAAPSRLDTRFLYYLLQAQDFKDYVRGVAIGTTVRAVRISDVLAYETPVPPLDEQHSIASILGSLDDKIALNHQMGQTLEQIAQALFKSWFVNFEPIRAKADGRWRKGESLPGMPAAMWDLWPTEIKASELGQLPLSWGVKPLSSLLEQPVRSGAYIPKAIRGNGARLVNMGELFGNPLLFDIEMERVPIKDGALERFEVNIGDLLFARRSMIGTGSSQCSIVCEVPVPTVFESSILRVRPDRTVAESQYLFQHFWSRPGTDALQSIARHGPISGITGTDLADLRIPVPPISIQRRFAGFASQLTKRIGIVRKESGSLAILRDSVLPKLLSAEIRVRVLEGSV